jgi:hypothetical protein
MHGAAHGLHELPELSIYVRQWCSSSCEWLGTKTCLGNPERGKVQVCLDGLLGRPCPIWDRGKRRCESPTCL